MDQKYSEPHDEQTSMASEPLAEYATRPDTVSVNEYFDELMLSMRIDRAEAGQEPTVSNSEVFDSIRTKYGF